MTTKLTLTLQDELIQSAKEYAAKNGHSLSDLVEGYFKSLPHPKNSKKKRYSPIIEELKGSIPLPQDFDYKKEMATELAKKYLDT